MSGEEIKCLRRKLKKARENGKPLEIHECCCSLAACLSEDENHEEALTLYKESLQVCESLNYKEGIALANRMIAEECTNLGYFDDALKHVNIFLDYATKENDKVEEQRGFVLKGHVFFTHAEYLIAAKSEKTNEIEKLLEQSMVSYRTSFAICVNQLTDVNEKEKNQMKARLLQNKSLVLLRQNKFNHAQNHLIRAIKICAKEKLKDTECLCYLTLGDLYIRKKEYHNALNVYDKAFELSNTSQKRVDALLWKAKTYISLENFEQTKITLRKAYKIRPDIEIKKLLQQIFAATELEKQLCLTLDANLAEKVEILNKLGKIYCILQLYKKSIKNYLNMLGYIQKMNYNEDNLANCYRLLARTFAKDGQYDKALFYSNQEVEIILVKTPEKAGKTFLKIAKLHELNGSDFEEIYLACDKAKSQAEKFENFKLQIKCYSYLMEVSNKFSKNDFADSSKKQLENLKKNNSDGICDSDSSSDSSECESDVISESYSNVDINEVLGDSEVESEEFDRPKKQRNKRKRFYLRKNEKGETDLHVAAIKGNYRKAKALIEKGHPVNIRDTAGWTPLHEACNHGYADIVNLLLDFGADINDKGGQCCDGITPLHDAATNGQLEIVNILIKRGASTLVLNNLGETPLQCLLAWRKNSALDPEEEDLFKNIVKTLKSPLDSDQLKWKAKNTGSLPEKKSALVPLNIQYKTSTYFKEGKSKESSKISEFRKSSIHDKDSLSEDSEESDNCSSNNKQAAFIMYRKAIKNLRHKPKKFKADFETENFKPALIDAKHYVENCIIQDEEENDGSEKNTFNNQYDNEQNNDLFSSDNEENLSKLLNEIETSSSSNVAEKNPSFKADYELKPWLKNISPVLVEEDNCEKSKLEQEKTKINKNVEVDIGTVSGSSQQNLETPIKEKSLENLCNEKTITVKIFKEIMTIPLNELDINSLKVDWLITKVAHNYPIIWNPEYCVSLCSEKNSNIKTSDAIFSVANENLEFSIVKWKSLPLNERYEKICQKNNENPSESKSSVFKISPQPQVVDIFKKFSSSRSLTLSNLKLTSLSLIPICKALAYESFIQVLNLKNNYFGDKGLELIHPIFERCVIGELNVSGCNITSSGVYLFSQVLNTMNIISRNGLEVLNLSNNLITDEAVEALHNIIEKLPNLSLLNIENCELETLISNETSPGLVIIQGEKFLESQENSSLSVNSS